MSRTTRKQTPIYENTFDSARDGKKWFKPNKKFKKLKKKIRKAKLKEEFKKKGDEGIKDFPHTDIWDWN